MCACVCSYEDPVGMEQGRLKHREDRSLGSYFMHTRLSAASSSKTGERAHWPQCTRVVCRLTRHPQRACCHTSSIDDCSLGGDASGAAPIASPQSLMARHRMMRSCGGVARVIEKGQLHALEVEIERLARLAEGLLGVRRLAIHPLLPLLQILHQLLERLHRLQLVGRHLRVDLEGDCEEVPRGLELRVRGVLRVAEEGFTRLLLLVRADARLEHEESFHRRSQPSGVAQFRARDGGRPAGGGPAARVGREGRDQRSDRRVRGGAAREEGRGGDSGACGGAPRGAWRRERVREVDGEERQEEERACDCHAPRSDEELMT
mmetsp:Transcript_46221/g.81531  ORF Transcript_46221/g.81531 Transcript_46221/m.81531 type:complete len:319 (-) Transcript_46221:15-971(-)